MRVIRKSPMSRMIWMRRRPCSSGNTAPPDSISSTPCKAASPNPAIRNCVSGLPASAAWRSNSSSRSDPRHPCSLRCLPPGPHRTRHPLSPCGDPNRGVARGLGTAPCCDRHRRATRLPIKAALGDLLRFFYTDERTSLGHYVEHVWMSAGAASAARHGCSDLPAQPADAR